MVASKGPFAKYTKVLGCLCWSRTPFLGKLTLKEHHLFHWWSWAQRAEGETSWVMDCHSFGQRPGLNFWGWRRADTALEDLGIYQGPGRYEWAEAADAFFWRLPSSHILSAAFPGPLLYFFLAPAWHTPATQGNNCFLKDYRSYIY